MQLLIFSWSWHHYCLLILGLVCAATDFRSAKIYNVVTYPSIAIGLLLSSGSREEFFLALTGFAIGFIPFVLASLKNMIGGGDAKLFGAVGAIGGVPYILHFLFWTFSFAAIYALLMLIWDKHFLADLAVRIKRRFTHQPNITETTTKSMALKKRVPLGIFALLSILATLRLLIVP